MTKEQALNFNPEEWVWRRSSGWAGYDHCTTPNDESTWISAGDYLERRRIKSLYNEDSKMLILFAMTLVPTPTPTSIEKAVEDFLDKKYFPITQ